MIGRLRHRVPVCGIITIGFAGCTSFGSVRSAEVEHGGSWAFQVSASSPPGDDAGWFWSFDCEANCNHAVASYDFSYMHGTTGRVPFEVGGGLNGTHLYLQGFFQLGSGSAGRGPWGVGGRVGMPLTGWNEHQLFGRFDVNLGENTRLLLSPMLYYYGGNSPNGANPGSFVGFVQGLGLERRTGRVSVFPALSVVGGHTERRSYGESVASSWTAFATASLNIVVHPRRR